MFRLLARLLRALRPAPAPPRPAPSVYYRCFGIESEWRWSMEKGRWVLVSSTWITHPTPAEPAGPEPLSPDEVDRILDGPTFHTEGFEE